MSNGKALIIVLIDGLIKKTLFKNDSLLPEAIYKFWRKYKC